MAQNQVSRDEPDPKLRSVLDAGVDEDFTRGIERAIELIQADDTIAFWLQAVGDGSPLLYGTTDVAERTLPLQPVHLAGYDDDLKYPVVRELAMNLYAHHVGVMTTPFHTHRDADEIIESTLKTMAERAEH